MPNPKQVFPYVKCEEARKNSVKLNNENPLISKFN